MAGWQGGSRFGCMPGAAGRPGMCGKLGQVQQGAQERHQGSMVEAVSDCPATTAAQIVTNARGKRASNGTGATARTAMKSPRAKAEMQPDADDRDQRRTDWETKHQCDAPLPRPPLPPASLPSRRCRHAHPFHVGTSKNGLTVLLNPRVSHKFGHVH